MKISILKKKKKKKFKKKKKKKIFNKNFSKIESKIQETLLVKIKTSKPSSSNIKANDNSNNTFFN